jgi:PAS domain S-box-containing protein
MVAQTTSPYDDLPDGVLVTDEHGLIQDLNTAGARLLGVEPEQIVGRPLRDALHLLDERGNDWWDCSRAVRDLPAVTRQPERRLTIADPDGERDMHVTVRYIREAGRLVRVVLCLRDTASRERMERSRADLVSTVAHELRSPLTSVKGFTATLLAKWERFSDEQKKLMLTTVNSDADRVTRLITEILDVSRIDSGRIQLRRQVVDICETARKVIAGRVAAGEAPADRFRLVENGSMPEMWLDPDKIEQVLQNLIENALRHGAGNVTIQVVGNGTGAEVAVADEGEGIAEAASSRVFSKFWRGTTRGSGTGLGLYIAKGLVEAHGGTISVGRGPVGGAEFRFLLPAGTPSFA